VSFSDFLHLKLGKIERKDVSLYEEIEINTKLLRIIFISTAGSDDPRQTIVVGEV
jgi:hypothetical protein